MKVDRLHKLGAVIAVLVTCFFAGPSDAGELDGVTLRVGTWSGPWQNVQTEIIAKKLEAMGATIEYVQGNPSANLAKLIAAQSSEPPIDVIEIIDATLPQMIEGDFLEPLDASQIPNTKYISSDRVRDKVVATWITEEGICYLPEKFKELGLPAPTTYADLANPKLRGRVMIPDFSSGGGLALVSGFALAEGGSLDNIQPGLDLVRKIEDVQFWQKGSQVLTGMKSGDLYAAVIHGGHCIRAYNAGLDVMSVYPKIDDNTFGVAKQGWIGIVKGTKASKAAHIWINEFLSAEFQVPFAKTVGAMPENRLAGPMLKEDEVIGKLMITDPDQMDKMLRVDFATVDQADWGDQWRRAVAR